MVKRDLFDKITPWLGEDKILVIKGARQTGKTTLLNQIKEYLEKKNKKTVYFSVDRELTNPIFKEPKLFLRFINDQLLSKQKGTQEKVYIFLDEFQYLSKPNLFIKHIFDSKKDSVQLIVSGSSSLEITHTSEFLTGRKIDFYLNRFSFKEFLRATSKNTYDFSWKCNDDISVLQEFYDVYEQDLSMNFLQYISFGGYPEVVTTQEQSKKEIILKEIISTYIQKDISGFLKVENINGFNNLVSVLTSQVGNLVNKTELSNTLDLNARTIERYLEILEGTYIFSFVSPFFSNVRKTLTKRQKVYLEDMGIDKIISGRASYMTQENLEGRVIENVVYNELSRKVAKEYIRYYRTLAGAEVDFVVEKDETLIPMEVKFQNRVKKIPSNLKKFNTQSKKKVRFSIVVTKKDLKKEGNTLFIPAIVFPFLSLEK